MMEEDSDLLEMFEKSAQHLETKVDELESEKLLYFYARFKQASIGRCNVPKPGFFDFQGKTKWNAWNELGDMSRERAMKEYIEQMKIIDLNFNPSAKCKIRNHLGPAVSTMVQLEPQLEHNQKTAFDFVKENLLNDLRQQPPVHFNVKDENGLALLHWACDRGHTVIVQYLLSNNANINILDENKQTPLHYASSCGHGEIVNILIENKADISIVDDQELSAKDVALNHSIRDIFK